LFVAVGRRNEESVLQQGSTLPRPFLLTKGVYRESEWAVEKMYNRQQLEWDPDHYLIGGQSSGHFLGSH